MRGVSSELLMETNESISFRKALVLKLLLIAVFSIVLLLSKSKWLDFIYVSSGSHSIVIQILILFIFLGIFGISSSFAAYNNRRNISIASIVTSGCDNSP